MREAGPAAAGPGVACARGGANECASRPASRLEPEDLGHDDRQPPRSTGPARAHARTHAGAGAGARPPVATVGAEAQGEVACRGSPGSRRRGGRGRMAEGAQPQQPLQLGPGAAARGMKRESELELPVPGGGGDGAEPGLSKRPRTEEAEAAADDGGGMQVTARDGRPVTAGVRRGAGRAARGSRGLERGGLRGSWLGSGRGPFGAWLKGSASSGLEAKGAGGPRCAHEDPHFRGDEGTRRVDRFWGENRAWLRWVPFLQTLP